VRTKVFWPRRKQQTLTSGDENSTLSKTHIFGICFVPLRSSPLHFLDGRIEVRLGGLLFPGGEKEGRKLGEVLTCTKIQF
jgi:hypothetical protein